MTASVVSTKRDVLQLALKVAWSGSMLEWEEASVPAFDAVRCSATGGALARYDPSGSLKTACPQERDARLVITSTARCAKLATHKRAPVASNSAQRNRPNVGQRAQPKSTATVSLFVTLHKTPNTDMPHTTFCPR